MCAFASWYTYITIRVWRRVVFWTQYSPKPKLLSEPVDLAYAYPVEVSLLLKIVGYDDIWSTWVPPGTVPIEKVVDSEVPTVKLVNVPISIYAAKPDAIEPTVIMLDTANETHIFLKVFFLKIS